MKPKSSTVRGLLRAPSFSPTGMILRALLIALSFAICHALGWREYTTFISGSQADVVMDRSVSTLCAVAYMAAYFGSVLIAPVLLLAAIIINLWDRVCGMTFRHER
jgi:hypothetical protein